MSRWLVAVGGVALMACLGTVYAWSVYTQPLQAAFGWTSTQATAPFSIAIFFLGVGAVMGGRWQDRAGPRPVALTGALLWGAGNLLAGLGTARFGAPWLYATYGVMGGLGLGLGYVTPVAAVTKWFPDRRGLGSGLVVGGFGLGAFLYAHLLRSLPAFAGGAASRDGAVLAAFTASGVAFAILGGAGALLVRNPPAASPSSAAAPAGADFTPGRMVRTPQFWAAFAMLFLNVTAGILFISNAVPIMRELTGALPATAAGRLRDHRARERAGALSLGRRVRPVRAPRRLRLHLPAPDRGLPGRWGASTPSGWWPCSSRWCCSATAAASG